jgi:hypothetical protein
LGGGGGTKVLLSPHAALAIRIARVIIAARARPRGRSAGLPAAFPVPAAPKLIMDHHLISAPLI